MTDTRNMIFDNLPIDLQKKIYIDHFELHDKYQKLCNVLILKKSMKLNYESLSDYLIQNKILDDKNFIEYMKDKNTIFNIIYNNHYIININHFKQLDVFDSFCLSWLTYLYH